MKKAIVLIVLVSVFSACTDSTKKSVTHNQYNGAIITEKESEKNLLLPKEHKAEYSFSNQTSKDIFKLESDGFDPLQSTIKFTITNNKGEVFFEESFKSDLLIDDKIYDQVQNPTNDDKKRYVINRMKTFFDVNSFSMPAITDEDEFTAEYSDRSIWEDIKSDTSSVGFYYLLGSVNGKSIAYSKKQNKVVVFFNCC